MRGYPQFSFWIPRALAELIQRMVACLETSLFLACNEKHYNCKLVLIFLSCTIRGNGVIPLPALDKAMRFAFVIRQFFGTSNQFLFLHCGIITCQANETNSTLTSSAFRCSKWGEAPDINAEKCPNKKEENMAIGPFLVWPEWLRRDLKTNRGAPNGMCTYPPKDNFRLNLDHYLCVHETLFLFPL